MSTPQNSDDIVEGPSLNSFDEWSALREVVLGSATNFTSLSRDLSFDVFFQDNITPIHHYYPRVRPRQPGPTTKLQALNKRYIEELEEDLQGIADVLASAGVNVIRPLDLSASTNTVQTLAWSDSVLPALNVRDIALVVGNQFIETSPMLRSRFFETQLLKPLILRYFHAGARWLVAPRPIMTDASFDSSYTDRSVGNTQWIQQADPSPYDVGLEPMFDGAQCLRIGRDLFMNVANENHRLGYQWLASVLNEDIRLHMIQGLSANHIDSLVLALRPGMLLVRDRGVLKHLPHPLNKWDAIVAPEPDAASFPPYEDSDLILTSEYIDLNVLSLDEETILVNEASPNLIRTLESFGFTCVAVRHRHRRIFAGGLHCFTLDTVRAGGPEDYL